MHVPKSGPKVRALAVVTGPSLHLAPRDVAGLLTELDAYHARFSPLFYRTEQRYWATQYLRGQLLDIPRKSIEPMVLALEGSKPAAVRAMQQFISEGAGDDAATLTQPQRRVDETLGGADGALRRAVAVRKGRPGPAVWVVFRRRLEPKAERKGYLRHAPQPRSKRTRGRISGRRWPVETALEACKGAVGMDQDVTRRGRGWPPPMTLTLVGHHEIMPGCPTACGGEEWHLC